MTDQLPDRLAIDPDSPFHNAELLQHEIGVRFNGLEKTNVEEYCISEGWIRVAAGKALDRKGKPLTLKLKGQVEVWIKGHRGPPGSRQRPRRELRGDIVVERRGGGVEDEAERRIEPDGGHQVEHARAPHLPRHG